jgi:CHAT domain-containing protein/tetratricopeptide (TPR) repeat protein
VPAPSVSQPWSRSLRRFDALLGILVVTASAVIHALGLDTLVPQPLSTFHSLLLTTLAVTVALVCNGLVGERFRAHPGRVAAATIISFAVFVVVCILFVQPVKYHPATRTAGSAAVSDSLETYHVLVGLRAVDPDLINYGSREAVVRDLGSGWSEGIAAWGDSYVAIVLGFVASYLFLVFSLILALGVANGVRSAPRRRAKPKSAPKPDAKTPVAGALFLFLACSAAFTSPVGLSAQLASADSARRLTGQGEVLAARPGQAAAAAALLWEAAGLYEAAGLPGEAVGPMVKLVELTIDACAHDSALALARRALAQAPDTLRPDALRAVGLAFEALGTNDSAIAYEEAALAGFRAAGRTERMSEVMARLGGLYLMFARARDAIDISLEALPLADTDSLAADIHDRLMIAYVFLFDGRNALDHARTAARLRGPDNPVGAGMLGVAYMFTVQFPTAAEHLQRALVMMDASGDTASIERAEIHVALAQVHAYVARRDSALYHLSRATTLTGRSCDSFRMRYLYGSAAWAALELRDAGATLAYMGRSREIHRRSGDVLAEASALFGMGTAHQLLRANPVLATAYYDSADARLGVVRGAAGTDLERVQLTDRLRDMHGQWALAWLGRSGEPEIGDRAAVPAALAAVERGRAQALLTLAAPTGEPPGAGADLAAEGRQLARAVGESGATAGLVYALTTDTLLVWVVDARGVTHLVRRRLDTSGFARMVRQARGSLGVAEGCEAAPRTDGSTTDGALVQLAALLLPDEVVSRLPAGGEVIVIPGGAMGLIPFAALPYPLTGEPLGIRYALRYAPSLAALRVAEARPSLAGSERASALRAALVVGDPRMPIIDLCGAKGFIPSQLEGAAESARSVAARLGAPLLTGGDATEAVVRGAMANAPLVHLETHAFAYRSQEQARASFIALASGPGGEPGEDGLLTVAEILDRGPTLRAELVVLSACETGLGEARDAEGVIGLPRALLAKGARSVLVSLWPVGDRPAALLMQSFYRHWLDGPGTTRAEALRRAQEELRAHPAYSHPRYWAAFQLIGGS